MKGYAKANSTFISVSVLLLFFVFLCMAFFAGCAGAAGRASQDESQNGKITKNIKALQIIIKFRGNITDPSEKNFIRELSRYAGAELIYLRPMSGGAHVFAAADVAGEEALKEIIKRLSPRPEIIYIQQDRIMRHQKQ